MRKFFNVMRILMLVALIPMAATAADQVTITSPGKKIAVDLQTAKGKFGWSVKKNK